MRSFIGIILGTLLFWACSSDPRKDLPATGAFGSPLTATAFTDIAGIAPDDTTVMGITAISGTVAKVCQGEGCWLSLETPDGTVKVEAKDKSFILPRNIEGKKVKAQGAFVARENKKGRPYVFEATGVVIE